MKRLIATIAMIVPSLYVVMAQSNETDVQNHDSIKIQELHEVIVNGEKPQVKGRDGIIVVDIPSIVKDKPVTNILESLNYLPGVTDNNGQIALTGATNVTIIINGELTNMPLENLYQMLYTTPIDRLKTVEVMYTAPAKYHVTGAVINIVLKAPNPLDGLQGQARIGYNQGHYASYGAGLAANYSVRDWAFDINYSMTKMKSWAHQESFSNHFLDGTRHMIEEDKRQISRNLANSIFASASYKTLKLTYTGQIISDSKRSHYSDGTLGDFVTTYEYPNPIGFHNIEAKYVSPFGMTIGGDYTRYVEERNQILSKSAITLLSSQNEQTINSYHIYVDQQHNIGKWLLSYGAEYKYSDDYSFQRYHSSDTQDFDESLMENVADAYVGVQHSFDCGLSLNASVRGEYYRNKYQHNWNLVPQIGVTYYKTPANIFQFNLSTERKYPTYWDIHGGTSYLSEYSVIVGNAQLQPSINYSLQFNYIYKQKYVATLYVNYIDKYSAQLTYQSPDELRLIYQTVNMNYNRIAGLNLHIPFNIKTVVKSTATLNLFNQREKADTFYDISFDNKKLVFYGGLKNSIILSKNIPVSLSVDVEYITPPIQGLSVLSSIWKIDAGAKWQFGKKRCCEFDLKANDILNTWSPEQTINHAGQDYKMKVYDMTRNLKLTFIYRFHGFKPKDNNIDTSRFGTGG
jgi:hypothetical protein